MFSTRNLALIGYPVAHYYDMYCMHLLLFFVTIGLSLYKRDEEINFNIIIYRKISLLHNSLLHNELIIETYYVFVFVK